MNKSKSHKEIFPSLECFGIPGVRGRRSSSHNYKEINAHKSSTFSIPPLPFPLQERDNMLLDLRAIHNKVRLLFDISSSTLRGCIEKERRRKRLKEDFISPTTTPPRRGIVVQVITILLLCPLITLAQSAFTPHTFQGKEGSLPYQLLLPENFSEDRKYPLILFLHGSGERGSDNQKQLVHGSELFLDIENQEKYPAVVVFPQCPAGDFWAKADFSGGAANRIFLDSETPTRAMSLLLQLADSITSHFFVDKKKIYVGGLSMGGMGTFELLSRRPETFAAAIPICGGGNPDSAKKYAGNLSLWIFHGAKDDVVYPSYSTDIAIALIRAGHRPKYTLYKDANHNSWDSAFAEPELLPWLFSQTKSDFK